MSQKMKESLEKGLQNGENLSLSSSEETKCSISEANSKIYTQIPNSQRESPESNQINTSNSSILSSSSENTQNCSVLDNSRDKAGLIQKSKMLIGTWEEAPEFLHDNEFLLRGYRINFNTVGRVLRSLFMWHNETVNIWTHLIGIILCAMLIFYVAIYIVPIIVFPVYNTVVNSLYYSFFHSDYDFNQGESVLTPNFRKNYVNASQYPFAQNNNRYGFVFFF